MVMTAVPLLEIQNLQVRFATPDGDVRAVNGVNLQVQPGETLGIVGESGSGKSVTMQAIMGLLPRPPAQIVSGSAHFAGQDLLQLSRRELRELRGNRLAIIFQDPMTSLNPVLTIGRQITEVMERHLGLSRAAARDRAVHLLERVGIPQAGDRLRSFPHQFSGGMRQRVAIAIGLACNPELLIADEPTTALDVTIQAQIVDLVQQLKAELGMATVWISHDLALLAGMSDRIATFYAGRVVELAPTDRLYATPRHPYTLGLLDSIPRWDQPRDRLRAIEGMPPNLRQAIPGCPFAPRCPYVEDRCWHEDPALEPVSTDHAVACWVKPDPTAALAAEPCG